MSRTALVLRPEPGNAATAERLTAARIAVQRCPLFAVAPVTWSAPDPRRYDALLLTSANAVRHAGSDLARVAELPVLAVGRATAQVAEAAGLTPTLIGEADAATLVGLARARGWSRLLYLTGRDHHSVPDVDAVVVYASEPVSIAPEAVAHWPGTVALLHSPRAARRFAELVEEHRLDRGTIALAALSASVLAAAGSGWRAVVSAPAPRDDLLVAAVASLIDRSDAAADKRA